jgi:Flp pilus assembly protein TadG
MHTTRRSMWKTERRRRGQSLTEFALVVPLLLLLVFGLIDFSRLLFTYVSVTNGARELARVVAITGPWVITDQPDVTNTVNAFNNLTLFAGPANTLQSFNLQPGIGTIACFPSPVGDAGCGIKLSVNYTGHTITFTPLSNATGSATYTMTGSSVPGLSAFGVNAVGDYAAVMMIEEGNSSQSTADAFLQICPLRMTPTCALGNLNMRDGAGGTIEVDTSYTFTYSPLFQNRLTGIIDASFMRQFTVLTTTTRTTGE